MTGGTKQQMLRINNIFSLHVYEFQRDSHCKIKSSWQSNASTLVVNKTYQYTEFHHATLTTQPLPNNHSYTTGKMKQKSVPWTNMIYRITVKRKTAHNISRAQFIVVSSTSFQKIDGVYTYLVLVQKMKMGLVIETRITH